LPSWPANHVFGLNTVPAIHATVRFMMKGKTSAIGFF
jgi:hypothetical protein